MLLIFTRKERGYYCGAEASELKAALEEAGACYEEIINLTPPPVLEVAVEAALAMAAFDSLDWTAGPWMARVDGPGLENVAVGRSLEELCPRS